VSHVVKISTIDILYTTKKKFLKILCGHKPTCWTTWIRPCIYVGLYLC